MFGPAEDFQTTKDASEILDVALRSTKARSSKSTPIDTSYADHILLIDEDPATRQSVASYFAEYQIPVRAVACDFDFYRQAPAPEPRLVLLDLRLGRDDSLLLLRELRSYSNVPIIVTTGDRSNETDRVVALELGADDYICKPCSLRELLARVRTVLRRRSPGQSAPAAVPKRGGFSFRGWRLECRARRLLHPTGRSVPLTKVAIPTKAPVCNGIMPPGDSGIMAPPCNGMIPPGRRVR